MNFKTKTGTVTLSEAKGLDDRGAEMLRFAQHDITDLDR
jgi:hypothetical protein